MFKIRRAYYSSGSRPIQAPKSWRLARLLSSMISGKAEFDYDIIKKNVIIIKISLISKQNY